MSETQILLQLKQGNKEAFASLYSKYWSKVYHFSKLYLTSKEDAEEIVQEVFIKLWDIRAFIREEENFEGFLFIITRNIIFNQNRRKINETYYKASVIAAFDNFYTIEEQIDADNLKDYIDQLISELPPRRREIFDLSRKGNKSYREIAELLNISEKTVENQISEALKYLKKNVVLLSIFLAVS
ncbi:MAG: RNA polymerase sigma-70 factor [Bacteroides sp.]